MNLRAEITTRRAAGSLISRSAAAALGALLGAAACASPSTPAPASPPASSAGYLIGLGDTLDVFVWNNPDISVTVPVRPDGRISTPLVEDMPALGKTPTQLARDIEMVLADYIRSPKVNVIVTEFVGNVAEQIRVVGHAENPQALPYRNGMTLLDVMIEVGGLAKFAAGNRAMIVRWVDGEKVEIPARLNDLLDRGRIEANVAMRPGDVLVIPQSRF